MRDVELVSRRPRPQTMIHIADSYPDGDVGVVTLKWNEKGLFAPALSENLHHDSAGENGYLPISNIRSVLTPYCLLYSERFVFPLRRLRKNVVVVLHS